MRRTTFWRTLVYIYIHIYSQFRQRSIIYTCTYAYTFIYYWPLLEFSKEVTEFLQLHSRMLSLLFINNYERYPVITSNKASTCLQDVLTKTSARAGYDTRSILIGVLQVFIMSFSSPWLVPIPRWKNPVCSTSYS